MRPISSELLARFREAIRAWWPPPPERGDDVADPTAGVRSPLRNGPSGRSSAIALVEPHEEDRDVEAVSSGNRRFRA